MTFQSNPLDWATDVCAVAGGDGQLQLQANSAVDAVGISTGLKTSTGGGELHQHERATLIAATERPVETIDILEQNELRK